MTGPWVVDVEGARVRVRLEAEGVWTVAWPDQDQVRVYMRRCSCGAPLSCLHRLAVWRAQNGPWLEGGPPPRKVHWQDRRRTRRERSS